MIRPMPTDNGSLESDIERLEHPTPVDEFLANDSSSPALVGRPPEFYTSVRDSLLQDITQTLTSLQETNGDLKAKVTLQTEALYSLTNKNRQLEDRNRQLQAALDEHKQKANAASSQLVSSEAQHKQEKETLQQHAYELETRVKDLEDSNAALQSALDKLKTSGPDASATVPEEDGELDESRLLQASILSAEHSKCKLQISNLTREKMDALKDLSKLKEEHSKLQEEHEKAAGERAPLEERMQQLKGELESASKTIDSHTATIEQQKQRNKALVEEVSRLRAELEEASSKTAQAMNSLHMSRSTYFHGSSSIPSASTASIASCAGMLNTSSNEFDVMLGDAPDGDPSQAAKAAAAADATTPTSRKRGQSTEVQTEASESKRVDVREATTGVGDSLVVPSPAQASSQVTKEAVAELEAKLQTREAEQKKTVARLELDLRNHTIEIAGLRKHEAELKAALAKMREQYEQQLKQEANKQRAVEQENAALKSELERVGQAVRAASESRKQLDAQSQNSAQALAQKDRCIEKLEAHVRELATKVQELEPKASQMELFKAQMDMFQKDFNLQKMSTEQAEAKNKRIEQELERLKKENAALRAELDRMRGDVERLTHEREEFSASYMNALQLLDETNQAGGRRGNPRTGPPVQPRQPANAQANTPPAQAQARPLYPHLQAGQQQRPAASSSSSSSGLPPDTLITCPYCNLILPDRQSLQIHVADDHDHDQ